MKSVAKFHFSSWQAKCCRLVEQRPIFEISEMSDNMIAGF